MSQKQSKAFKDLQDKWYAKLKKSGFEDIEQDESHLKWSPRQSLSTTANRGREVFQQSKEIYYRIAGHFLHEHAFESKTDLLVWQHHAEGKSMREISLLLKKQRISMATTPVKETIHRLRALMFDKYRGSSNEQE